MLIDILIFTPVLTFTLLGWRDGIVRKIVACVVIIVGLFLAQIYMHDVGTYLVEHMGVATTTAPSFGFLIIFLSLIVLQGVIYKLATGSYKIGGIADHIGGTIIGLFEGILFTSCILYLMALNGTPSRRTAKDSQFYKPVVNIAPQILDVASGIGPETVAKLKELGISTESEGEVKKDSVEVMVKKRIQ